MKEELNIPTSATPTHPPAGMGNGERDAIPSPPLREMSWEEFEKTNRQVGILHDGLFRRLAEHDRQR